MWQAEVGIDLECTASIALKGDVCLVEQTGKGTKETQETCGLCTWEQGRATGHDSSQPFQLRLWTWLGLPPSSQNTGIPQRCCGFGSRHHDEANAATEPVGIFGLVEDLVFGLQKNTPPVKHNKVRCDKMRYACTFSPYPMLLYFCCFSATVYIHYYFVFVSGIQNSG